MSDAPEDRGPSSLRVVAYDHKNPIHAGIMASRDVNSNIQVPARHDKVQRLTMPVAAGMEAEPTPSTRYPSMDTKTEPYVYQPPKARKKAAPKVKKEDVVVQTQVKPASSTIPTPSGLGGLVDPTAPSEARIKQQNEYRAKQEAKAKAVAARIKAGRDKK